MTIGGRRRAAAAATLVVVGLALLAAVDPLRPGLTARYFANAGFDPPVVRTTRDARLSTDSVIAAWRGRPPEAFGATWSGSLVAVRGGTYTFAIAADGPSRAWIDSRPLVALDARQPSRASGSASLARGVHTIFIQYSHAGGPPDFHVFWGGDLEPLPSWALSPRPAGYARFLASVLLRRALPWAALVWLAAAAVVVSRSGARAVRRAHAVKQWPSFDAWLIAAGAALLFFVLPHDIQSDGRVRYYALAELIEWGDVSIVPYSLVGPLASAPLYFLGRVWMSPEWWCARFNTLVFISGLVAMHRLLRGRADPRLVRTFLLLLAAASMFPYHLEGYFAEVFTAVLAGVGLLAVSAGHPAAGWTAAAIGVANTPATLAALAPAAAWHAWQTRRPRHLVPIAAAGGLIMVEAWLRRGSPFVSGYAGNHGETTVLTYSGRPGFSYPIFFGVLSVLFSFGKGLVFYAPACVLAIRDRFRGAGEALARAGWLWTAFLAGLIVVYSKWWAWYGGLFWGPRFFLFASIPASLALATRIYEPARLRTASLAATFGVLTLSAWVAIDGVAFDLAGLGTCRDPANEWLCLYVPEYSPLWRPFVEFTRPTMRATIVAAYFAVVYVRLAAPIVVRLLERWTVAAGERRWPRQRYR
jgi:PA14 domain